MDLKPLKVERIHFTTNNSKQPNTSHSKAKQTSYTPTFKDFIDDMYESEAKQLKAMGMFLKANGLISKLQRHDWAGFARGYNGSAYAKNQYDTKLAAAYNLAKKQGW